MAVCTRTVSPEIFQRAHEREAIDYRREHAHVVRGRAIHPAMRCSKPAPNVASSDDNGQLDAELLDLGDLLGELLHDLRRNIVTTALFAKGFATQFEDDTFVVIGSHRILNASSNPIHCAMKRENLYLGSSKPRARERSGARARSRPPSGAYRLRSATSLRAIPPFPPRRRMPSIVRRHNGPGRSAKSIRRFRLDEFSRPPAHPQSDRTCRRRARASSRELAFRFLRPVCLQSISPSWRVSFGA